MKSVFMKRCRRSAVALGLSFFAAVASAQEFPAGKPIELTCLFPPGTAADVSARVLAEGMSKQLGTNVIVVNRPGAGGAIGYKHVASRKPDGYSLVWNSGSISTTYHGGLSDVDYKAFEPIARVVVETPMIAVHSDAPWKTLRDFINDAKAAPGKIMVGNSGTGSHTHFTSVALFKHATASVTDVPFASAQVVPSLLGKQVNAVVQLPGALSSHYKAGSIRILAAFSAQRDPAFPQVPTAIEQGYNMSLEAWRGVAAPKGTPKAVLARLEDAIRKTVASPEFTKQMELLGAAPAFLSADEFGRLIAKDDRDTAQMMAAMGLLKTRPGSAVATVRD